MHQRAVTPFDDDDWSKSMLHARHAAVVRMIDARAVWMIKVIVMALGR
jgi:hypothetical protein